MLAGLKSLNQIQQTVGMRQNNLSLSYCSYIRYLRSNILLFIAVLSLDNGLTNISEGEFYTLLFSKTT